LSIKKLKLIAIWHKYRRMLLKALGRSAIVEPDFSN